MWRICNPPSRLRKSSADATKPASVPLRKSGRELTRNLKRALAHDMGCRLASQLRRRLGRALDQRAGSRRGPEGADRIDRSLRWIHTQTAISNRPFPCDVAAG